MTVWICLYILKYLDDFLNLCKVKLRLCCMLAPAWKELSGKCCALLQCTPRWAPKCRSYSDGIWIISEVLPVFPLLDLLCYQFSASILGQRPGMVVKDDSVWWNRNPPATFPRLIRHSRVCTAMQERKELLQREILLSTVVKECGVWCRVTWSWDYGMAGKGLLSLSVNGEVGWVSFNVPSSFIVYVGFVGTGT